MEQTFKDTSNETHQQFTRIPPEKSGIKVIKWTLTAILIVIVFMFGRQQLNTNSGSTKYLHGQYESSTVNGTLLLTFSKNGRYAWNNYVDKLCVDSWEGYYDIDTNGLVTLHVPGSGALKPWEIHLAYNKEEDYLQNTDSSLIYVRTH